MIIIGEKINGTRENIKKAIEEKDKNYIRKEIRKQIENDATYIDLNAGTGKGQEREKQDIKWLIEITKEEDISKICIDSSDPDVIKFALDFVENNDIIINSINGEKDKKKKLLDIIKGVPECKIIVLTMDDNGIPKTIEKKIEIAKNLIDELSQIGMKKENIFIDCLVEPISLDIKSAMNFLKCVKKIKEEVPEVKTTCGLSNVSFGLPKRKIVNKYFLSLCIYEGIDSVIIDPTIIDIKEGLYTTNLLTGNDEFCMNYIRGIREGRF